MVPLTRLLLRGGASPSARDDRGRTAVDLAIACGNMPFLLAVAQENRGAALTGKVALDRTGDVVIVVSGRNVDEANFSAWIGEE